MPTPTMRQMYARRYPLLAAAVVVTAGAVWLLAADLLRYVLGGSGTYLRLVGAYGEWVAPSHGINGILGLDARSAWAHAGLTLAGLATFAAAVVGAIGPRRDWGRHMLRAAPLPGPAVHASGFVAALVTVGAAATLLEPAGLWSGLEARWGVPSVALGPLALRPAFWVALAIGVTAHALWVRRIGRPKPGRDRYIQLIIVTYVTFVAGGLLTAGAAALQIWVLTLQGAYWHDGTYTGALLGATAMLWTLGPSMVLIFYSEYYYRVRNGLCTGCGYDVRGTRGDRCPECGSQIEAEVEQAAPAEEHDPHGRGPAT